MEKMEPESAAESEEQKVEIKCPLPGKWVNTFNEDFEGDELDSTIWNPHFWFEEVINNEEQAYVAENIIVKDGICKILVEKKQAKYAGKTLNYASGMMTSYGKFLQTYGYFEARVKMPEAKGLWPGFWMWPDRGKDAGNDRFAVFGPESAPGVEIDIMEYLTEWDEVYHTAIHWCYEKDKDCGWGQGEIPAPGIKTNFHTFGVNWSTNGYDFYYDGKKTTSFTDLSRISKVPSFILFGCAVGGNWPSAPIEDSKLPDALEVDYIRAWQMEGLSGQTGQ